MKNEAIDKVKEWCEEMSIPFSLLSWEAIMKVYETLGHGITKDDVNETDIVNHPPHYTSGKYECIDVIEDWDLGYRLGNAIKYICRSPHKGKKTEDLEKAIWYIRREIEKTM